MHNKLNSSSHSYCPSVSIVFSPFLAAVKRKMHLGNYYYSLTVHISVCMSKSIKNGIKMISASDRNQIPQYTSVFMCTAAALSSSRPKKRKTNYKHQ